MEPANGKKTRNTRQRGVILDILRETRRHPSAEAIYLEARADLPNISLGTVYRNLNHLCEQGAVTELSVGGRGGSRFEATIAPHAHLHCTECDSVVDLPLPACLHEKICKIDPAVASIERFQLLVTGCCTDCSAAPSAESATN